MAKKLDYSGPSRPGRPAPRATVVRGHVVRGNRDAARADWRRQTAEEDARRDWMVPLCVLGAAAVVYLVFGLISDGLEGAAAYGIAFCISAAVNAVVGVIAAYMVAGLTGASFGPFWTAVLKLAAASTVASIVGVVFTSIVPLGCVGLIVYCGTLAIMCQLLLELEGSESYWFVFIFVLLQVAANVLLSLLLADII